MDLGDRRPVLTVDEVAKTIMPSYIALGFGADFAATMSIRAARALIEKLKEEEDGRFRTKEEKST